MRTHLAVLILTLGALVSTAFGVRVDQTGTAGVPEIGIELIDASVLGAPVTVTEPARVRFVVRVLHHSVSVQEPEWAGSLPDELQLEDQSARLVDGPPGSPTGRVMSYTLTLNALAPGSYTIAPVEFRALSSADPEWSGSVSSEALTVTVESILTASDSDLADIKDPFDPPPDYLKFGLLVAGGVLVAVLLAAGIAAVARRRPVEAIEPPAPAHVTALAEIDALLASDLIASRRWKAYFGELSGVLRRYIEKRFDLHAPTQTTEEFLRDHRTRNMFEPQHDALVRGFLGQADMIKFAEGSMDAGGAREAADRVRTFVEETGVHIAHEEASP